MSSSVFHRVLCVFIFVIYYSCSSYELLPTIFDFKDEYIWVGKNQNKIYQFEIDSIYNRVWYDGKLIVNEKDTFLFKGFQKGSNHPSKITIPYLDTFIISRIHFWANHARDTLRTKDYRNSQDSFIINKYNLLEIPEGTIFTKRKKIRTE